MSAVPLIQDRASYEWVNKWTATPVFSLGLFWVVQQHFDCQVHQTMESNYALFGGIALWKLAF